LVKVNCVLFIPVSSPSGIGEYMRSLVIAKAMLERWPDINIHFILNDQVNYLQDCPYTVHTSNGSPTKDVKTVNLVIRQLQPDLVIFDASGRASQFKQAKSVGAKVAFISQHNKKRNRGLKLNRLLSTNVHWVVQPDYCIKVLSFWQTSKLALFNKSAPKNIGAVFESSNREYRQQILEKYKLVENNYFIVNAGSGGHIVEKQLAADIYYEAAELLYQKTNIKCVVVFGSNYPKDLPKSDNYNENDEVGVLCLKSIDNKEFVALITAAKGCIISAGDTLLQAIALHKPCIAAPISQDQPARLKVCANKGLVLPAKPSSLSLVGQALKLIKNNDVEQIIISAMSAQAPVKALEIIMQDIENLLT